MKKLTSLLVVVALTLGMMAFAGCWFEAQSISFVEAPATTFTLGENVLDFTIRVNEDGTTKDYRYSDYKGLITVSGFNTDTVGSRRATVTYDGKFSLRFDYTVVNDKFAGGTGTEFDPYLVGTPKQFQNLLDATSFKYYKLTNSIDFKGIALNQANKGTADGVWTGVIDGAEYSLLNICKVLTKTGATQDKYGELFGNVGTATEPFVLKNITINYASEGDSMCNGLAYGNEKDATILFENVHFTGYMNAASTTATVMSAAFNYAGRRYSTTTGYGFKSVTFKNCTNSINILNSYAVNYVSGYFAGNNGSYSNTISFNNCSFNGIIEGALTLQGAFATQDTNVNPELFSFENCSIGNEAKLYATCGMEKSGPISINKTVNSVASGIQLPAEEYRDNSFAKLTVTKQSDKKSFTISGADFDSIKVFVYGGMKHEDRPGNPGGTFRYLAPTTVSAGVYTLAEIDYSGEDLPTDKTALEGYGNNRFFDIGGTVTYFGKGTCTGIDLTKASLTVVAYKDGVAVAAGKATEFNLKA